MTYTIKIAQNIADIPAKDWDACANGLRAADTPPHRQPHPEFPFLSHAFLTALEACGVAGPEEGRHPCHLLACDPVTGQIEGCLPCYVRTEGEGDWLADYAMECIHDREGKAYHPKLLSGVPLTPLASRRLLVRDRTRFAEVGQALTKAALKLTREEEMSSFHLSFVSPEETELLTSSQFADTPFLQRSEHQFAWTNQNYQSFDDFLGQLTARKRKMIRKERKALRAAGLSFEWYTGDELTEQHWDLVYKFYRGTFRRKYSYAGLPRRFFSMIGQSMAQDLGLVLARRDGEVVAGASYYMGSQSLYGRYWGYFKDIPYLHFELCYYQSMEFAIAHGVPQVNGGWGPMEKQKMARGFLPFSSSSLHYISDTLLRQPAARSLAYERQRMKKEARELNGLVAYKQS